MIKRFSTAIHKNKWREISAQADIEGDLLRSYKMRPMQKATIILDNNGISDFKAEWGLVPEWSKDGKNRGTLINARFENLLTSPSFRIPIRQKRCLIPSDSFYIWHKTRKKQLPFRVLMRNEEPFFIAGLWDKWNSRYGTRITFSIITNDAGEHRQSLGDRVPMIFGSINEGINWLQSSDLRECMDLLKNPRFEDLRIYRISESMENINDEKVHEEVKEEITLFD